MQLRADKFSLFTSLENRFALELKLINMVGRKKNHWHFHFQNKSLQEMKQILLRTSKICQTIENKDVSPPTALILIPNN